MAVSVSIASTAQRLEMINLTGRAAHAIIWLYFATMASLAVWTIEGVKSPYPTLIAVALFAAVCVVGVHESGDRMSVAAALFTIAVGVTNTLIVSWQLWYPGYTQWYFGAATVTLFYASLRGRIALAWLGFVLISVAIVIWGATSDSGLAVALVLAAKQAPILLVGTLFAIGLRRSGDDILRFNAEATARAVSEATTQAAAHERNARLGALGLFATPMLASLASGSVPSNEERVDFALAEAELRDGLRARSLGTTGVPTAARRARARGVEVVLLDDSLPEGLPGDELATAALQICQHLDAVTDGRITVRLLPAGREAIATIVVDGSSHSSHEVMRGSHERLGQI
jgi:hypothetical protein